MASSSPVVAGTDILATSYNNLRSDCLDPTIGHDHEGVDGKQLAPESAIAGASANLTTTNLNTMVDFERADTLHYHQDLIIPAIAGENLTAGDYACIRSMEVSSAVASEDAEVREENPTTNYASQVSASIGSNNSSGTADHWLYMKFDISSINITTAENVFLRLYMGGVSGNLSQSYETNAYLVTGADWSEGVITWNTKPAISGSIGASMETSESNIFRGNLIVPQSGNWIFLDITTIYNNWKAGTANYGIAIRFVNRSTGLEEPASTRNITVYTSEETTVNYRPTLVVSGISNNAGKLYKANATNFTDSFGIGGFVKETVLSGASALIQTRGVATGLSGLTIGSRYYINDSEALSTTPGTLIRPVGRALSATTLLIENENKKVIQNRFKVSISDSGDTALADIYLFIPTGFKPTAILFDGVFMSSVSAGYYFTATGRYYNGVQVAVNNGYTAFGDRILIVDDYLVYWQNSGPSNYIRISVSSVLETGVILRIETDTDISASGGLDGTLTIEE